MREPLLLPVSALAGGILIAHFYFFELPDLYVPVALALAAVGLAFTTAKGQSLRLPTVCALMVMAGMVTQVIHRHTKTPVMNAEDTETVLLSGCVTNPPVFSPTREQFTLEIAPQAAARITVNLKTNAQLPLRYGQTVEVAAKIRTPRNFGNPDAFDYAGYLASQHIYWTGSVSSPADIRTVPGKCGSTPVTWLYNVRTWALGRLVSLYPNDPETAALLQATLLGETSSVDRRWTNDFRLTGTYHALVISGQHISVLAFTLLVLLKLIRIRRVPALCITTIASWLYAFISGMSSPVVRAAGGFTLFLAASYFFRKTRILNILGAIGLIYLAFDPDQLFDPSFQLSFLSAAAIAVFAIPLMEQVTEPLRGAVKRFDQFRYDPKVEARAARWRVELRLLTQTLQAWTKLSEPVAQSMVSYAVLVWAFVAEMVIVSACVQFGLALPMIAYFHRLSLTGLSANIVVIPLLSVVVPLGFAAILTGWHFLAWLTAIFLKCAELVATWHVRFEPSWRMAAIPVALSVSFAISLVLLAIAIRCGRRWIAPLLVCSLALFSAMYWQPWRPELRPHMLEVTAIDVSQGDSILLVFPSGETMLVDAGGFPGMSRMARKPNMDMGEDVVSPYLWSRRIRHLDYAVLTHGHSDHMGGLPAILDNFHPRALWIGAEPETDEWKVVQQRANADHIPIVPLTRNSPVIDIGGAKIRILAPSPDYAAGESATNNDSLVFQVTYGRRSVLLTGDAERPVEDDLVQSGFLHPVTLLKVGHHGSKTSSSEEFLDQVTPQFAFISDGYKNQFHHPSPGVLERFAQHHTSVYRTDQHGLVTFLTDGNKVELNWFH
ncbi:MAG TPA: DNA internalization-related competence protein ComEC/Rec2 [Bryobacteraceae bacterium]|nr:DNA internalization-related competence protein ComEC/Rec2 [Bryobacteraceae bacterium]